MGASSERLAFAGDLEPSLEQADRFFDDRRAVVRRRTEPASERPAARTRGSTGATAPGRMGG